VRRAAKRKTLFIRLSRRLRAAGAVYQGQFDPAALLAALKTLV
jgi:hypothetical protein